MKKGEMNWILIGMILAMAVLLILIFIYGGQMKNALANLNFWGTCESKGQGASCVADTKCPEGSMKITGKCDGTNICCISTKT